MQPRSPGSKNSSVNGVDLVRTAGQCPEIDRGGESVKCLIIRDLWALKRHLVPSLGEGVVGGGVLVGFHMKWPSGKVSSVEARQQTGHRMML